MGESEEMLILGEACIKERERVCVCVCVCVCARARMGTCVLSGQRNE